MYKGKIIVIDTRLWAYMLFHRRQPLTEFISYVHRLLKLHKANKLIFAWDNIKRGARRKALYPEYKAHRKVRQKKETVAEQNRLKKFNTTFTAMQEYLKLFGSVIDVDGYEADDIANIIAERYANSEWEVIFLSKDIDWCFNLIAPNISVIKDENNTIVTASNLSEHIEVETYQELIDYEIYAGIAKENVTGIKGLGITRYVNALRSVVGLDVTLNDWLSTKKYGMVLPDGINTLQELVDRNTEILKPVTWDMLSDKDKDSFILGFNSKRGTISDEDRMLEEMEVFDGIVTVSDNIKRYFKLDSY